MYKLRKIVAMVMIYSFIVLFGGNTCEAGGIENRKIDLKEDIYKMECMQPYIKIMNEVNDSYYADMAIPTEEVISDTGADKRAIVEYYLSIDINQFKKYLIDLYMKSQEENCDDCMEEIMPMAYSKMQRYVFANGNYLYFYSTVYTADGAERYGSMGSIGESHSSTPYYKPSSYDYVLKDGQKKSYDNF